MLNFGELGEAEEMILEREVGARLRGLWGSRAVDTSKNLWTRLVAEGQTCPFSSDPGILLSWA